jgi:orotidine-5'-phosphate decarboxylase
MCAWKKTGNNGEDYQEATRAAAIAMKEDIARFTKIV